MFCYAKIAGAALLALTPLTARADVKVVQEVTIHNPQIDAMLQRMAPAQRAQIGKMGMGGMMSGAPTASVSYFHGSQMRVDTGTLTLITNVSKHTLTSLNSVTHTYTVSPFSVNARSVGNFQVRETGQTKMVAGHLARRYLISESGGQGGGMSARGEIWSAPDLPQPAYSLLSPSAAGIGPEFRKVKGMPLILSLNISGGPMGATTFHVTTRSVSTHPLPSSLFSIPAGYHQSTMPQGMGGGMVP